VLAARSKGLSDASGHDAAVACARSYRASYHGTPPRPSEEARLSEAAPRPDHGEDNYRRTGRLRDKKGAIDRRQLRYRGHLRPPHTPSRPPERTGAHLP